MNAAAIHGTLPAIYYSHVAGQLSSYDRPFFDLHVYTIQIGTLVLQVSRSDPVPTKFGALDALTGATDIEVPTFPPSSNFVWPSSGNA